MFKKNLLILLCLVLLASFYNLPTHAVINRLRVLSLARLSKFDDSKSPEIIAAVLPGKISRLNNKFCGNFFISIGSPLVTGTIAQGLANGISLYSNILLARFKIIIFMALAAFIILHFSA